MYIFKNIEGNILRHGQLVTHFSDFIAQHPDFPMTQDEWFEYGDGGLVMINNEGHHIKVDENEYQPLINAILQLT